MSALGGVTSDTSTLKIRTHREYKKADRKMVEKLNYEGIEFPVRIKDVKRIEKQKNIRISVFGHSGNK
jgi:hypothetical protein